MKRKAKLLSAIILASFTSAVTAADICVDKDFSDLEGYVTTIRSLLPPISKAQESTYLAIIDHHESPSQALASNGDQTFTLWRIWYFSNQMRLSYAAGARATTIKAKLNAISKASTMAVGISSNLETERQLLYGPNPTREGLLFWVSAQQASSSGTVGLSKVLRCYAQQLSE